ncbi:MAG: sn-glycerol-1-phosphate dehydrogenase [Clostridia bacterium]|nr:sn-glycerol-1-phosphate dehydrogenase [Clostridia bacterium]
MQLFHSEKCACGKIHDAGFDRMNVGSGAVGTVALEAKRLGGTRAFLLSDENTAKIGGDRVKGLLTSAGIPVVSCVLPAAVEPDEAGVDAAEKCFDPACDLIVTVGSGVLNDIGKCLAAKAGVPYIVVATAPSMDGYASSSAAMVVDGLKVSLPRRCADVLIGDTDLLMTAPDEMLIAGLGDMIAKYVSIAEWRISHLVTGEYYCERVAAAVREALSVCVKNAKGLLSRDPAAIEAVFEGLVLSGAAMNYAGLSRPASGVEHYFSHIWDMRGLAFKAPVALHGTQCAVGTLCAATVYDKLLEVKPDRDEALRAVRAFDRDGWFKTLRAFVGPGADAMIAAEARDGKYDPVKHEARLGILLDNWQEIQTIVREEIPRANEIRSLLASIGAPTTPEGIGQKRSELPLTFAATRDVRDKYVLSRLVWDLGLTDLANACLLREK